MIARSLHFKCATTDLKAENDHRASVGRMSDIQYPDSFEILHVKPLLSSFPDNCQVRAVGEKRDTCVRYYREEKKSVG